MWEAMLAAVADVREGVLDLGVMIDNLRGLFVEADSHDASVRSDFEGVWTALWGEHSLRTDPQMPKGLASEENLATCLEAFEAFVRRVLASDTTTEHR